jgi:hypothetical protein
MHPARQASRPTLLPRESRQVSTTNMSGDTHRFQKISRTSKLCGAVGVRRGEVWRADRAGEVLRSGGDAGRLPDRGYGGSASVCEFAGDHREGIAAGKIVWKNTNRHEFPRIGTKKEGEQRRGSEARRNRQENQYCRSFRLPKLSYLSAFLDIGFCAPMFCLLGEDS